MIITLTEQQIINNLAYIKDDPANSRKDLTTPEEYIAEAKLGKVYSGGVQVVIEGSMPPVENMNL